MRNSHLIIFIVITLFFGTMFGLFIGALALSEQGGGGGSFASGWNSAKNKLYETGSFQKQMTSIYGTVKEAGNNQIVFEASLPNPLEDESLKTRKVLIGKDTELVFKKLKDEDKYRQDKENGMIERKRIDKEIDNSQADLENCYRDNEMEMGIDSCASEREMLKKLKMERMKADLMADRYEIVDNFSLSDVKPNYLISVQSLQIENTENNDNTGAMRAFEERENILDKKVFSASRIEITETQEMDMGVAI